MSPARANLIVDGSFETPSVGSSWSIFANGQVPGWTSNNNEIEIDYSPILGLPGAYDGTQSVELNGNTFDTISQLVTGLTLNQTYRLTWAYAGRSGSCNEQMNVLFGGAQVGQNTSDGDGAQAFADYSTFVTATATSETLSFAAINVGGSPGLGNELDAVTLTAVPEPGSLALLVSAVTLIAGMGLVRGRQT